MSTPVCTVCIANYNGEALLPDCIDSVLQQDCDLDLEIIVHDDASTDASVDILKSRYPGVRIIESEENVGFCISNNRMAAQANGDYLLLLNNDAALYPDALSTLISAARSQDKPGILSLPQYDWETGTLIDRGCLLDPFYNPAPNLDPDRDEVAYVIGACLWIPRALWETLDGFPEWMGSIAEDMYLGCRARLMGSPVNVVGRSGYRHRQGASFGGNKANSSGLRSTYQRRYLSERNKTAVLLVCTPTPLAYPLLVIHLCELAMEGFVLAFLRLNPGIFTKIYSASIIYTLRHIKWLLSLRKRIQSDRETSLLTYLSMFTPGSQKIRLLLRYGIPSVRK